MANVGFLASDQLDFNTLKTNFKTFLQGQEQFADFNFEGSNMSTLIDLLTYNTYNMAYYLNQVGSEMFLDTAALRESAVSRANELNYLTRSRNSAKGQVLFTHTPNDVNTADATVTVPRGFYVSGTANNVSYLFSTNEAYVLQFSGDKYQGVLDVYEGRLVTETFTKAANTRFIISSSNVDVSSIQVIVQPNINDSSNTVWTRKYNFYGLTGTDEVFFVDGYKDNQYELKFGNDIVGKSLENGNFVTVTYRDTNGADANGIKKFGVQNELDIPGVCTVIGYTTASGGAERETLESIKFNAPRHYATQDRAITKTDYVALIKANFPTIEAITVFGGEELAQKRYGKVVISAKPFGAEITPTSTKNSILAYLNDRTAVAIDPLFIDPEYFHIKVTSIVSYNPAVTSKTASDIEAIARARIDLYNSRYLYDFNNDFRFSKMASLIDDGDASIVSNDTKVYMGKRITPVIGVPYTVIINYNNALKTKSSQNIVTSSAFTYLGATAYITDDGAGNLYIYKVSAAGVKTTLKSAAGTVNYTTGKLVLTEFSPDDYSGHISIFVEPASSDIIVGQQQILQIKQEDVGITVIQAVE